jgi:hypothetical protein
MSNKKLDLSKIAVGRSNIDRNEEQRALPSSGSATPKHKLSASQSNGAGNASRNAGQSVNGMAQIMPGGAGHSDNGSAREVTAVPKSRTPDKRVQSAKANRIRIENGKADPKGGY